MLWRGHHNLWLWRGWGGERAGWAAWKGETTFLIILGARKGGPEGTSEWRRKGEEGLSCLVFRKYFFKGCQMYFLLLCSYLRKEVYTSPKMKNIINVFSNFLFGFVGMCCFLLGVWYSRGVNKNPFTSQEEAKIVNRHGITHDFKYEIPFVLWDPKYATYNYLHR